MKRFIITAALIVAGNCGVITEALADHNDVRRSIRQDYQFRLSELERRYDAHRSALKYDYHRERDLLLNARDRVRRIDCHEERAIQMRLINRELSGRARAFHQDQRVLTKAYLAERRVLQDQQAFAIRDVQRLSRPVLLEATLHDHPVDCSCTVCAPPVPRRQAFEPEYVPSYGHSHHRRSNGFDWTNLVIGLINNRLSR